MKKFVSLLIAFVLLVSMFATSVVAFAADDDATTPDGETEIREVGFDEEAFWAALDEANLDLFFEMSSTFMLSNDWLKDAETVQKVFPGIIYVLEEADDEEDEYEPEATAEGDEEDTEGEEEVVTPNDKIYIEYCRPSDDPRDSEWQTCAVTSTFSMTSAGDWYFRYAVVDGAKASVKDYSFDSADVLARSSVLERNAKDTTNPVVDLSSSMKDKHDTGLTAGTNYTVSTSLTITDCSSTTTTYEVYKKVGKDVEGADSDGWILIYDSKTSTVTEGYEDSISTTGTIKPSDDDVTGEYIYKIVYTVVDAYGNIGVRDSKLNTEYHPELLLKVNAAAADDNSNVEIWKIVLYVIAGASAIGIIVLLCIKPKQEVADGRYNANATEDNKDENNK